MSVSKTIICTACSGTGQKPVAMGTQTCAMCAGAGRLTIAQLGDRADQPTDAREYYALELLQEIFGLALQGMDPHGFGAARRVQDNERRARAVSVLASAPTDIHDVLRMVSQQIQLATVEAARVVQERDEARALLAEFDNTFGDAFEDDTEINGGDAVQWLGEFAPRVRTLLHPQEYAQEGPTDA